MEACINPFIIFKDVRMNPDLKNNVPAGSCVAMSETEYIKESFLFTGVKTFSTIMFLSQ
jgi:hypothetical protein